MWLTAVLSLALLGAPGDETRTGAGRCVTACERHVSAQKLRTRVCGSCLLSPSPDRGAWVMKLGQVSPVPEKELRSALTDPDWAVRWGAARALGAVTKFSPELVLMQRPKAERALAELTLCHAAAAKGVSPDGLLSGTSYRGSVDVPRALASMEVELYGFDGVLRRDALRHLSKLKGVPAARVVLDAMASRGAADEAPAQLLVDLAPEVGIGAAAQLVAVAKPGDEPLVNRLFAVWSKELDVLRPKLRDPERSVRHDAIREIGLRGPLGDRDLFPLLSHEVQDTRLVAAYALARGEGRDLPKATAHRLSSKEVSEEEQRAWLSILGRSGADGCKAVILPVVHDEARSPSFRGDAVRALATCAGPKALPELEKALASKEPAVRAGAIDGLSQVPRSDKAVKLAVAALSESEPLVLAAALRTVSSLQGASSGQAFGAHLTHADPRVRVAAIEACEAVGAKGHVGKVAEALESDADRDVRAAAAKALGGFGGPRAASALSRAAKTDADGRVRFLAADALRRLGFSP